jgi:Patatin-like phospholipase
MRTFSHPVSTQPAVSHRPSLAPRTAFVLAGGGSLGAMQVGMLRGLYERGVAPDLLVGTSAGALNAAFIASRPQTVATAEALAHVWRGAERIYLLATEYPAARAVPLTPRGALDAAVHAFTLLVGARLQSDLARYATAAELIVLPAVNRERIQPTDFDHASRLIAHALAAARTALAPQVVEPVAA